MTQEHTEKVHQGLANNHIITLPLTIHVPKVLKWDQGVFSVESKYKGLKNKK